MKTLRSIVAGARVGATLIAAALLLTACATSQKQNVYQTGAVQQQMRVKLATVIDVREVDIEGKSTGVGASAGGSAGAVIGAGGLGSASGNYGKNGVVGAIAGAVAGGVVGAVAEKTITAKKGQEVIYQVDGSSDTLALVQEVDDTPLKPGDRVRLIEGSFSARLVKLGVGQQPAAAK